MTLVLAIGVSLLSIVLCTVARTFGMNSTPTALSISADYSWLGWMLRVMAGILALVAFVVIFVNRRRMRQQFVARNLGRTGIVLATAALFWEVAVPAATIALIVVGLWAFFTGPGDLDFGD